MNEICHIFLGNAIQNNACACVYVICIVLKREWMATAQFKKNSCGQREGCKKWILSNLKFGYLIY